MAIVRHLARLHALVGENEAEQLRADVAVEAIRDADHHLGALASTHALADFRQQMAARPRIAAYLASGRRPEAIMIGPRREAPGDFSEPGPMDETLRKIYPANDTRSREP